MLRLPNLLIGWNPYPSATRRMDLHFYCLHDLQFRYQNIPFVLLYIFLGGVLLFSAYSLWEKDKNNRR